MPARSIGTRKRLSRVGFGAFGSVHAAKTHQRRHPGVRRPDLLPGDPPAIAVGDGAGAQRREIGPGLRLGKPLTPNHFPGCDRRQVACLLFCGSVPHQRGPDPVDAHVLRTAGFVVRPHLLAQYGLLPHRAAAAAVFLRPGQSEQPVGGEQLAERLGGREVSWVVGAGAEEAFWDMRGYQLAQSLSEVDGVGAKVVIHRHPFGNPSSRSAMMLRWISDVPP